MMPARCYASQGLTRPIIPPGGWGGVGKLSTTLWEVNRGQPGMTSPPPAACFTQTYGNPTAGLGPPGSAKPTGPCARWELGDALDKWFCGGATDSDPWLQETRCWAPCVDDQIKFFPTNPTVALRKHRQRSQPFAARTW